MSGDITKKIKLLAAGLFTATLTVSTATSSAYAQWGSDSVGGMMVNIIDSSGDIPLFLAAISYLFGLVLGAFGIAKFYEHVNNPHQTSVWEGIKRMIAGGAFFALPTVTEAVYNTMADGILGRSETGFNTPGAEGQGLDAMLVRFVGDIWEPLSSLISAFAYIAAIILVMVGISRLLKTAQEGPRGPGGIGTIMTFLTAGALFSIDRMLGAFGDSMFTEISNYTYAVMNYQTGMDQQAVGHVHTVISAGLGFVMLLGMISFVRGWFIIKDHADGNQQASLMAGVTHLIGGALAVNLGPFLNAVQSTLGLTEYGVQFGGG